MAPHPYRNQHQATAGIFDPASEVVAASTVITARSLVISLPADKAERTVACG